MTTEDQEYFARLVGRAIAQERALLPLIGSSQKGDAEALHGLLQMNFEMGRTQIPGRLAEAGLPADLQRMAEDGFYTTTKAILDGVKNGKYIVPTR